MVPRNNITCELLLLPGTAVIWIWIVPVRGNGATAFCHLQNLNTIIILLTPLGPQSRFGGRLLEIWMVCPQHGTTAVLKGLTTYGRGARHIVSSSFCFQFFFSFDLSSLFLFSLLMFPFVSQFHKMCSLCLSYLLPVLIVWWHGIALPTAVLTAYQAT